MAVGVPGYPLSLNNNMRNSLILFNNEVIRVVLNWHGLKMLCYGSIEDCCLKGNFKVKLIHVILTYNINLIHVYVFSPV